MTALELGAHVAGHALAAVDALHGVGGDARVELAPDQGVGDGVVVALDLDVGQGIQLHPLDALRGALFG